MGSSLHRMSLSLLLRNGDEYRQLQGREGRAGGPGQSPRTPTLKGQEDKAAREAEEWPEGSGEMRRGSQVQEEREFGGGKGPGLGVAQRPSLG